MFEVSERTAERYCKWSYDQHPVLLRPRQHARIERLANTLYCHALAAKDVYQAAHVLFFQAQLRGPFDKGRLISAPTRTRA